MSVGKQQKNAKPRRNHPRPEVMRVGNVLETRGLTVKAMGKPVSSTREDVTRVGTVIETRGSGKKKISSKQDELMRVGTVIETRGANGRAKRKSTSR